MPRNIICVICAAVTIGCAAEFNPNLGGLDGSETGDSTTDVGTADTGAETDTSGSTTGETDTGSTDETGSTGDGDGDGDTTGGVAECGNGTQEENEECDGEDFGEGVFACSHVGFWLGTLGCHEDCTYDVSSCSEGLPQPEDGNLWSDCDPMDPQSCNNALECTGGLGNPAGYFCTQNCEHVSECGALPGGTAAVICDQMCLISCESGNCPAGMTCQFSPGHDQSLCF
jgi:hypothetical protein